LAQARLLVIYIQTITGGATSLIVTIYQGW